MQRGTTKRKNVEIFASRIRGKAKRIWLRLPVVDPIARRRLRQELRRYAPRLPYLEQEDEDILAEIRHSGISCRYVADALPASVQEAAQTMCRRLATESTATPCVRLPVDAVASQPTLFRWGLNERMLNMAENYIGRPVRYLGVEMKREKGDAKSEEARRWHVDVEDRNIFKIIIYLNDVDADAGPFEYIDRQSSALAIQRMRYLSGYVADGVMARFVPRDEWRAVTGQAYTAVIVDSAQVFHRIRPPVTADRYSITYSYTSTKPFQTFPDYKIPISTMKAWIHDLSPRQQAAALPIRSWFAS